jgi:hypothetical protein
MNEDRDYYVSVRRADRQGFLLGPYATHEAALAEVGRGRDLACAADPWAWFYAFGTASLPRGTVCRVAF